MHCVNTLYVLHYYTFRRHISCYHINTHTHIYIYIYIYECGSALHTIYTHITSLSYKATKLHVCDELDSVVVWCNHLYMKSSGDVWCASGSVGTLFSRPCTMFTAWMSIYIKATNWDAITHTCPSCNDVIVINVSKLISLIKGVTSKRSGIRWVSSCGRALCSRICSLMSDYSGRAAWDENVTGC